MSEIYTSRLWLRPWRKEDLKPFAALNADPKVMEFFPCLLTAKQSDNFAETKAQELLLRNWGLWAVEERESGDFIGFIGLNENETAIGRTVTEVGWRLAQRFWGKGYATEGAKAALKYGFTKAGLETIYSWTSVLNQRSEAVMKRIGMQKAANPYFAHQSLDKDHPLSKHVLYEITEQKWKETQYTSVMY